MVAQAVFRVALTDMISKHSVFRAVADCFVIVVVVVFDRSEQGRGCATATPPLRKR